MRGGGAPWVTARVGSPPGLREGGDSPGLRAGGGTRVGGSLSEKRFVKDWEVFAWSRNTIPDGSPWVCRTCLGVINYILFTSLDFGGDPSGQNIIKLS